MRSAISVLAVCWLTGTSAHTLPRREHEPPRGTWVCVVVTDECSRQRRSSRSSTSRRGARSTRRATPPDDIDTCGRERLDPLPSRYRGAVIETGRVANAPVQPQRGGRMARTRDEDVGDHGDDNITTVLRRSNRRRAQKRFTARSPFPAFMPTSARRIFDARTATREPRRTRASRSCPPARRCRHAGRTAATIRQTRPGPGASPP
jgi:hypothetical protein